MRCSVHLDSILESFLFRMAIDLTAFLCTLMPSFPSTVCWRAQLPLQCVFGGKSGGHNCVDLYLWFSLVFFDQCAFVLLACAIVSVKTGTVTPPTLFLFPSGLLGCPGCFVLLYKFWDCFVYFIKNLGIFMGIAFIYQHLESLYET